MSDADFMTPLERAYYAAGMMLDIGTIQAEQDYHRRRLNRLRYWFAGSGTIVGLAVTVDGDAAVPDDQDTKVEIRVGPGVGIDGLGRDFQLSTPYCLDLLAWINADGQTLEALRDGLNETENKVRLTVTAHHEDCPTGLRPVLARKLNASTDPVDTSSVRDATQLLLTPGPAPKRGDHFWPWPALARPEDAPPGDENDPLGRLNEGEQKIIDETPDQEKAQTELAARLIYGLRDDSTALGTLREADLIAPVPLAEISIDLRPDGTPIIHPGKVTANNLVRPMVATAAQLDWLARQAT